nr:hypothetical protein HK105_004194 [Polyrhizophydium stewartii]
MSSSTQASFTFSFTFSDSTDGGSGGGGAPTPTSSLLETSLRELNLSTSALDPPSTLTPSSSESSIALPPFGVVSAVASADAETTITTRGFRFTQMVHNDWDPRTRNQLLVIRHVYLEQREALVARLTDAWQQMRAEFTRNDTLLPISQATMEDLDKSITSLISHTILLLQYHALGRVFELAGTSIPPECVLPEEALKIESVFKKRATEAMKRASNGDLLLSFSQIAALETNTAAEGVCSKLEKKRLAAKTGLELNEVAIW